VAHTRRVARPPRDAAPDHGDTTEGGMRRLVVCADGTWNDDDAANGGHDTNVVRLARAIAPAGPDGTEQTVYYHAGVGTGGWWDRMTGGAFGNGISRNIKACYRWIAERYRPGDELFFFGFSRGAYTVRSLAGLVRNAGVLRPEHVGRVDEAYDLYRDRDPGTRPGADASVRFRAAYAHEADVACLGVWDTVGALGVPTRGPVGWVSRRRHGFHDVALSSRVRNAFHALAIDERRRPFAPTLWEVPADDPACGSPHWRVEQRWFAGVHSNVGGGYPDCGLSNFALRWMAGRAAECGLALRPGFVEGLDAECDCAGELYDSMSAGFKALGQHVRALDAAAPRGTPPVAVRTYEEVDASVVSRHANPATRYAPDNFLHYWRRYPDKWAPAHRPPA
jgi:uncharacterized protein (DUF2235 family)